MAFHDLSPQQQQVLAALLSGETVSAAARQHDVHRSTIHNWLRGDSRFRAAMDQGRACLEAALFDEIQDLAQQALDTIRHILADPNASPSVRLRAASIVLKMAHVTPPPDTEADADRHISTPAAQHSPVSATLRYSTPPPGRNEPCHCGSGRKFKHCCLDKTKPIASEQAA